MKNIYSSTNGRQIPVTADINVKPLKYSGKVVVNGNGSVVMDNRWIYVRMSHGGLESINVNRSQYCEKIYLSNVLIKSSFSGKMTKRLEEFIEKVSDKLVFEKDGITYRVYLKQTRSGYDLSHVKLYWINTHSPNLYFKDISKRYLQIIFMPKSALSHWAHELHVDLEKAFNFPNNEN